MSVVSALVGPVILGATSLAVVESGRRLQRAHDLRLAEGLSRHRAERTPIDRAADGVPISLEGTIRADQTIRSPLGDEECVAAVVTARLDIGDGSQVVEISRAGVPFTVVDESGSVCLASEPWQLVADPGTVFRELTPAQRTWVEARLGAKVRHLAACEEVLLRPGQHLVAFGQLRESAGRRLLVGDEAGPTLITQSEAQVVSAARSDTMKVRALVLAGWAGLIAALVWGVVALIS